MVWPEAGPVAQGKQAACTATPREQREPSVFHSSHSCLFVYLYKQEAKLLSNICLHALLNYLCSYLACGLNELELLYVIRCF